MHQYELMVILDPEVDERTVPTSLDKFLAVITQSGGSVENIDIWGKRRLAYEIMKKSEGIYAVVDFTATPDASSELDRQLGLSEAVLRTKIIRADEGIAQRAKQKERESAKAARAKKKPAQTDVKQDA
ncbi:30S ribosomal protein S6 [Lysinibacter sp. HNR]|uniref:30S ribosomal protein S6 n=1 Tax=Lysinibacter sp. HNR TaxID=3031408 RepID=UPI0024354BDD|nr:30S ribosomal protein S6 [Lysinibacter sp. HNR]WGD37330.1 30S ribosomal protein S6 [Lysinibacter sp. HNR]